MNEEDLALAEEKLRKQGVKDSVTHFASGIAVIKDGKVLVVRRVSHDWPGGMYELPGGGIDEGETFEQSVIREAQEELGLEVIRILHILKGFDYQTPRKPKARQINFLVEVSPGNITLNPEEHDAFKWVKQDEIENLRASEEIKHCLNNIIRQIRE